MRVVRSSGKEFAAVIQTATQLSIRHVVTNRMYYAMTLNYVGLGLEKAVKKLMN